MSPPKDTRTECFFEDYDLLFSDDSVHVAIRETRDDDDDDSGRSNDGGCDDDDDDDSGKSIDGGCDDDDEVTMAAATTRQNSEDF